MNTPLISIITPTYNRANFLEKTIKSVLSQDYKNIEYIIVDDGSSDNTKEIIQPFLADSRVSYYYHDNIGEAKTTNRGYSLATGELTIVVNSDDPLWRMDYFTIAVKSLLENPEVLAVYPDWVLIDSQGHVKSQVKCRDFTLNSMISDASSWCLGPGMIIKRKTLKEIGYRNTKLKYTGDLDISLKLLKRGNILHLKDFYATHCEHEGNIQKVGGEDLAEEFFNLTYQTFLHDRHLLSKECLQNEKSILEKARRVADSQNHDANKAKNNYKLKIFGIKISYRKLARLLHRLRP